MGRKAVYWGKETDEAILEYNQTKDEQLFNERIYPAIKRLAYSILHNYNAEYLPSSRSEFMLELIGKIYEDLPRFDPSKGSGFSYFNVIARNYCWEKSNETYLKLVRERNLDINSPDPEADRNSDPGLDSEPEPEFDLDKLWDMLRTLGTAVEENDNPDLKLLPPCIVYLFEHASEINPEYLKKDYIFAWLRAKTGLRGQKLNQAVAGLRRLRTKVHPDEIC